MRPRSTPVANFVKTSARVGPTTPTRGERPQRRRIALFRMIVASHRPPLMPVASAADTKPRGAATSGVPGRVPHDIRLLRWLGQMLYSSQYELRPSPSRSELTMDKGRVGKFAAFASAREFEQWLAKNHAESTGIWLRFFKKNSSVLSVSYDEASTRRSASVG